MTRKQQLYFLAGILAWVLFVFIGYYYYHKPISLENLAGPLRSVIDLVISILLIGLCGGVGRLFLGCDLLPPVQRAVVHFCIGAGVLSIVWMGLGILGLFGILTGAMVLLVGWIVLFRQNLSWFKGLFTIRDAWREPGITEKFISIIAAFLVLYQLVIALSPPLKWDALAYHLQLPRQYLAAGNFLFIPENPYWGHPQIVEMIYTLAMSIHRAETAAVINWWVGILVLLGTFSLVNSQVSRIIPGASNSTSAGWISLASLLVGFTFRYEMGWSYADLFCAVFGLGALIIFSIWLESRQSRWFVWTGIFCGLAMGVKWTSGVLTLGFFLAVLIFNIKDKNGWKDTLLKLWFPGGAAVLLSISPWLLKNFIATGNPFFPYFLNTTWFDGARLASANPIPDSVNYLNLVFLPVTTTITGVDSAPGFGADLGPLLLLLALPGFLLFWRERMVQSVFFLLIPTGLALAVAGMRFGHLAQTRLYFAVLPGLALPAGLGWEWIRRQNFAQVRLRRIFSALILLVFFLSLWQDANWQARAGPGRVVLGQQPRQSYLENNLGFYILAMQELGRLSGNEKILMLWEPRGFYAPLNAQADLWIDTWRTYRRKYQAAQAVLDQWKNQGVTHLLVYQAGVELMETDPSQSADEDRAVYKDFIRLLPEPKTIGEVYYLYDLSSPR